MKIYTLESRQQIPISLENAWDFFSSPGNLKIMTPPDMGIKIMPGYNGEKMYAGQIISYIVTPLAGIPMSWLTEITHVQEPDYFVDEQRFGPYALWHHKHFFNAIPGGVEMRDLVHYGLPLGIIGQITNSLYINKKLKSIFEFRTAKLEELFGKMK